VEVGDADGGWGRGGRERGGGVIVIIKVRAGDIMQYAWPVECNHFYLILKKWRRTGKKIKSKKHFTKTFFSLSYYGRRLK
jgi:hypothetical protein